MLGAIHERPYSHAMGRRHKYNYQESLLKQDQKNYFLKHHCKYKLMSQIFACTNDGLLPQSCSLPPQNYNPRRQFVSPVACRSIENSERDQLTRREAIFASFGAVATLSWASPSTAVQGLTAGRIPGVTGPDSRGLYTYTRPEGKSGGHGVGWSEIPRYQFNIPAGWEEKPVSIADLGGTEIDLRFENIDEGNLQVIVAPILRFMDVGYNASVSIQDIGPPDKIIAGFAPELYGKPLMEDDVIDSEVVTPDRSLLTYYRWQVKPHHLVAATAVGNRLFILSTTSNSRQWRRAKDNLIEIQKSFRVLV